jgi:hypothetical protein
MKKIIRLTEGDLHKIIKESVKKILKEETFMDNHIADNIFDDFIQRGLYRRLQPNMFKEYIMKSYGLKPGEERIADIVTKKVEKYKLEAENEYGLTESQLREDIGVDISQKLEDMLFDAVEKYGEGGFSTNEWGKYVYVKTATYDGNLMVYLERGSTGKRLMEAINGKYRDKIVGFKPDVYNGHLFAYVPCFDEETQSMWDNGVSEFQRGMMNYYDSKRGGGYTGD